MGAFYDVTITRFGKKYIYGSVTGEPLYTEVAIKKASLNTCQNNCPIEVGERFFFYGCSYSVNKDKALIVSLDYALETEDEYNKALSEAAEYEYHGEVFAGSFLSFAIRNKSRVDAAMSFYDTNKSLCANNQLKPWQSKTFFSNAAAYLPLLSVLSKSWKAMPLDEMIASTAAIGFPMIMPKKHSYDLNNPIVINGRCFTPKNNKESLIVRRETIELLGDYLADSMGKLCDIVSFTENTNPVVIRSWGKGCNAYLNFAAPDTVAPLL